MSNSGRMRKSLRPRCFGPGVPMIFDAGLIFPPRRKKESAPSITITSGDSMVWETIKQDLFIQSPFFILQHLSCNSKKQIVKYHRQVMAMKNLQLHIKRKADKAGQRVMVKEVGKTLQESRQAKVSQHGEGSEGSAG